jgi:hypothetical protein
MTEASNSRTKRTKGCALLLALCGMVLLSGNFFPPLQLMGCAVTPSRLKGQVLDQDGKAITEAHIVIKRHLTPFSEKGEKTSTMSDSEGHFSYFGLQGFSLFVSVSKDGYYPLYDPIPTSNLSHSERSFSQFDGGFPHPRHREVFHLFRPPTPEALIQHEERSYRIARDGTPLIVRLNPTTSGSQAQIELRCWTSVSQSQESGRYDWRAEIRPKSGALVRRKDAFDFIAPTKGYEPMIEIQMPAHLNNQGDKRWTSHVEVDAFYHFEGDLYARAKVRFIAGGDHFVVFESLLNPKTGSKNLSSLPKAR